jgi:LmbE family N-acetylglucosaminyl deacetylase/fructoselysine-6-P-deglycase FrlB-like protein
MDTAAVLRSPLVPCTRLTEAITAPGPWLVVAPHEDDLVLGVGLTVQRAREAGIAIEVAVVSDGRFGYTREADAAGIVARRRAEMEASCRILGLDPARIHWLGFPDGDLPAQQGLRRRSDGSCTGIAWELTRLLRQVRPGLVFGPTPTDLHPDHRAVASELDIACFHASGEIWLDLGKPIALPVRWDYAVYCPFAGDPEVQVRGSDAHFQRKLDAIAAFASQTQIAALVAAQRAGGPVEHLKLVTWKGYNVSDTAKLFNFTLSESDNGYARDCRRTEQIVAAWSATPWAPLVEWIKEARSTPVLFVAEGSSGLIPCSWALNLARRWNVPGLHFLGGREAQALDLTGWRVVALSNSGRTREVIELLQANPTVPALAITGVAGGPLGALGKAHRVLLDQPEEAVAATVSVVAQALIMAQAVAAAAGRPCPLPEIRQGLAQALNGAIPAAAATAIAGAKRIWWAGDSTGVAAELALKTVEVAGIAGIHLPGTLLLHGVEEVFEEGDVVVAIDPPAIDRPAIDRLIRQATPAKVIILGTGDGEWPLADFGVWGAPARLAAGWRLLGHLAALRGRDPAKPKRARKVGNPMPGMSAAG